MYRIKILSGVDAGKAVDVSDGVEIIVGRQKGNTITLASDRVSKKHCSISVHAGEIHIKDLGSSNGTFVNGSLVKNKKLKIGDKVTVGEFTLEIKKSNKTHSSNILPMAKPLNSRSTGMALPFDYQGNVALKNNPEEALKEQLSTFEEPKTLLEKIKFKFENYVMPFFYNLNQKSDWKSISFTLFLVFMVFNLMMTVSPIMNQTEKMVMREASRRALLVAKLMAERNSAALSSGTESMVEIGSIERADGIESALIIDLDNRIIAPSTRINQFLISGGEAIFAAQASKKFKQGQERGVVKQISETVMAAIEPIKSFDSRIGKNIVIAMALVSVDASPSIPTGGALGLIFSESFIISLFIGLLIFWILYRLTLKPLEFLSEDLDKALKGDSYDVSQKFKFEDLAGLWDLVRSAVQRIPKNSLNGGLDPLDLNKLNFDEVEDLVKGFAPVLELPTAFVNSKNELSFLNEKFEDITGIRNFEAQGKEFSSQARDQGFGSLLQDLFQRVQVERSISEPIDFSGVSYTIHAVALGSVGQIKGCMYLLKKVSE